MAIPYDSIDIAMSGDYDLILTQEEDVADTSYDVLIATIQEVRNRVQFEAGSWRLEPSKGVLYLPYGQFNNAENAEDWEDAIYTALTHDGFILGEDLEITTAPLSEDAILTLIEISCEPTEANGFRTSLVLYNLIDIRNKRVVIY